MEEPRVDNINNSPNTLVSLTQRFLQRLMTSNGRELDLKSIATELHVPKRRIYDITNVMEGQGT